MTPDELRALLEQALTDEVLWEHCSGNVMWDGLVVVRQSLTAAILKAYEQDHRCARHPDQPCPACSHLGGVSDCAHCGGSGMVPNWRYVFKEHLEQCRKAREMQTAEAAEGEDQ